MFCFDERQLRYSLLATSFVMLPASAHHSDAGLDMEVVVAFEGTVRDFVWRNPHTYVVVEAAGPDGRAIQWDLQMGPINVLSCRGWRRDTLTPGDAVTVRAHVAVSGRPYGVVESIDKPGGLGLVASAGQPQVSARATTIEGKWMSDRAATMSYPGGFDGFFHALTRPNAKGLAAQAAYDPLSDENPEATCIGRSTPAALVSSSLYLVEIDVREDEQIIVIRSETFAEERTVYMDGRMHPGPGVRFATGYSIGSWEGGTLVIDTANFEDHRSPHPIGIPSGGRKHVIERYRLADDGRQLDVEFTLEDPEYMAEPMVHSRPLLCSPHLEMFAGECDPEATRRFVED